MRSTLEKYLTHYAAIPAAFPSTQKTWNECVIIPAKDEAEFLPDCLRAINAAAHHTLREVLAIIVINESGDDSESIFEGNRLTLRSFANGLHTLSSHLDIFVTHQRFPSKVGVGRARKMGADLAVNLWAEKQLTAEFIRTTDADARVPLEYFSIPRNNSVAYVYPFFHDVRSSDTSLMLYEIFLRYYVLGLHFAGSPYSFHTLGSCLAFTPKVYAEVRGFPQREAGEDFYFLNKVSKVGGIGKAKSKIQILPRVSSRTPFGTGQAVSKIQGQLEQGEVFCLDDPQVFWALKRWLIFAQNFCESPIQSNLGSFEPEIKKTLDEMGAPAALETIASTRTSYQDRWKSFHVWFDGLKTLRFIHGARRFRFEKLDYAEALKRSAFIDLSRCGLQPIEIMRHLRVLEGID